MIRDRASAETVDVCVVGAGPAGLVVALTLETLGRSVVLLESGGIRSSRAARELGDGDVEGEPYAGLARTRHRQIGGTPHIWDVVVDGRPAAKYAPLSPRDMASWPLGWQELRPFYVEAQELCGLGPFEYGAEHWSTAERRPFALDGTGLTSGVYQFGHADCFTRTLVDRVRSSDAITLVPSATVVGLDLDHGSRRMGALRIADERGRRDEVKARVVILACGAVENARLLLLSGAEEAHRSPWLGRCFQEHARDFSLVLVPQLPELLARASFYDLHRQDGVTIGGRLALREDAMERFRLPNASMTLVPRWRSGRGRSLLDSLLRGLGRKPQGRYGWSRMGASACDSFQVIMNLEHRPRPENRIELGDRKDRFGNPLPRLVLRWSEEEQAELERLRELLGDWFRGAKLGRLLPSRGQRPDLSAHHHAGTTRMAAEAGDGVVDPDGLVFGCENLYLAGASVFPSAGFANPTLTIVALALRLARQVATRL